MKTFGLHAAFHRKSLANVIPVQRHAELGGKNVQVLACDRAIGLDPGHVLQNAVAPDQYPVFLLWIEKFMQDAGRSHLKHLPIVHGFRDELVVALSIHPGEEARDNIGPPGTIVARLTSGKLQALWPLSPAKEGDRRHMLDS